MARPVVLVGYVLSLLQWPVRCPTLSRPGLQLLRAHLKWRVLRLRPQVSARSCQVHYRNPQKSLILIDFGVSGAAKIRADSRATYVKEPASASEVATHRHCVDPYRKKWICIQVQYLQHDQHVCNIGTQVHFNLFETDPEVTIQPWPPRCPMAMAQRGGRRRRTLMPT